jgi:hypothetical protein
VGCEPLNIEEESAGRKVSGVSIVVGVREEVGKARGSFVRERLRELHETLSPVAGVINRNEEIAGFVRDKVGHEIHVSRIALPRWSASKELPRSELSGLRIHDRQEALIDRGHSGIRILSRSPSEVNRNPCALSLQLSVMKEAHPWREI